MEILLLVTFIFIVEISLLCFRGEICSPAVVFSCSFLLAIICYLYNYDAWNISCHLNTYLLLTLGAVAFIVVEFLGEMYENANEKILNKDRIVEYISIPKQLAISINVILVIISSLYGKASLDFAKRLGYSGAYSSEMIAYVRRRVMNGTVSSDQAMGIFYTQSIKLVAACAYVFLLIFVNNVIARGKREIRDNLIYLVAPVLYCVVQIFLSGNRRQIISLGLAGIIFVYFINCKKHGSMYAVNSKMFMKALIAILLMVLIFSALTSVIGRGENSFNYITAYLGGGIELLDKYFLNSGRIAYSDYFGKETFDNLYDFLRKIGLAKYSEHVTLEFHKIGILYDNVYTAYRKLIKDFGYLGMTIFHLITIVFFTCLYHLHLKLKMWENGNSYLGYLLIYGYCFYVLVFYPFENFFYNMISLDTFVTSILMWILYIFLIKQRFVFKIR